MHSISNEIQNIRVSSVLNNNVKNYGKHNIIDGAPDTCWSSNEGKPQWISMELKEPHKIGGFTLEFQGGFVGRDCKVEMIADDHTYTELFYPEDANGVQKFILSNAYFTKHVKFIFNDSTDFFGRIILYSINLIFET